MGRSVKALLRRYRRWRDDLLWRLRASLAERRARGREPALFNAARGRPAWQSSTHGRETLFGARQANTGRIGGEVFSRTQEEDRPWWMVKLAADWPIHSIRIHPPRMLKKLQSVQLQVSISVDGKDWEAVHCGEFLYGDAASPGPLVIRLLETRGARYLKLELRRGGRLLLHQVEVMVAHKHKLLRRAARRYGFSFEHMTSLRMPSNVKRYSIVNAPRSFDGRIEAFHLDATQGRFGNQVRAIGTAVALAARLGIARVYIGKFRMLEIDRPIRFGDVTVLSDSELMRDKPKGVLRGPFFFREQLGRAADGLRYRDIAAAARAVAQPIFPSLPVPPDFAPAADDLVIHFRAGDIFARHPPHPRYPQPPLAFYRLCVEVARERLGIRRAILIYEDEGNPCVGAVWRWLEEIGLPCLRHSGTFEEDLAILLAAQHCVFGRGSFGLAVAMLSKNLRTVLSSWLEPKYAVMRKVAGARVIEVEDAADGYTKVGDWQNTPEQLRLMLEYPFANLRLKDE
jgi:hypothetical protein